MNKKLATKLSYVSGYREHRQKAANFILEHQEYFPELLKYCFSNDEELAHKACWVTEYVCKSKLDLLYPHLNEFTQQLPSLRNESSIRPMAKVCELLCEAYFKSNNEDTKQFLKEEQLEKLVEINFDWLIADVKVATKAYAMHSLFLLGKKYNWIYPELKQTLLNGIPNHSAAYTARARHILKKV
ncbi:hypothetical protein HX109_10235 [Galbibacter sp. BG1]|uniref:hypothetical protein n=1 Tax=Galbibacter sp. BG1 TaxID=1170699 RepID=UPI0015BB3376|nr:hypothetical protein [Galbibacter sp. BG1]QLE01914.1 hypothetical protein HX109_10235 [Galbibacter sp. BG1]